ncbi:hypothetical protein JKP88DRAFT_290720 [Tribonema minus]|uniref:Uncharacterized protein n=1 Tax=Tribonema minus TaxID=303371 RepID=A0A835Z2L1_9STRA|nr:hypothetical protein JKP88DRAFT_320890 [Tribonema minus]KAG5181894.1 hypothetical protein JKP88DRAFT_290720 [Tribonema minus]
MEVTFDCRGIMVAAPMDAIAKAPALKAKVEGPYLDGLKAAKGEPLKVDRNAAIFAMFVSWLADDVLPADIQRVHAVFEEAMFWGASPIAPASEHLKGPCAREIRLDTEVFIDFLVQAFCLAQQSGDAGPLWEVYLPCERFVLRDRWDIAVEAYKYLQCYPDLFRSVALQRWGVHVEWGETEMITPQVGEDALGQNVSFDGVPILITKDWSAEGQNLNSPAEIVIKAAVMSLSQDTTHHLQLNQNNEDEAIWLKRADFENVQVCIDGDFNFLLSLCRESGEFEMRCQVHSCASPRPVEVMAYALTEEKITEWQETVVEGQTFSEGASRAVAGLHTNFFVAHNGVAVETFPVDAVHDITAIGLVAYTTNERRAMTHYTREIATSMETNSPAVTAAAMGTAIRAVKVKISMLR